MEGATKRHEEGATRWPGRNRKPKKEPEGGNEDVCQKGNGKVYNKRRGKAY
jgi:hypothetical protein